MDAEKLARLREAANEFATYARLEYEQLVALRDPLAAHEPLAARRAGDDGVVLVSQRGRNGLCHYHACFPQCASFCGPGQTMDLPEDADWFEYTEFAPLQERAPE